ncbi:hypothetical protein CAC42_7073 [Sphaceloma murrayae]|uniref:2-dehydropantoate 2-reductase n=1 Tax=Sphaceloma murrayae TaxID=2082308 RepID=A0A2K1QR17_9PEZI|nr:hypothetical protein CAC42_7073 [Sphaceloma murrayae]
MPSSKPHHGKSRDAFLISHHASNGFHIDSAIFGSDIHINPTVYPDITSACPPGTTYDYLIVTTKAFPSATPVPSPSPAAASLAPAISPTTTLVLIQNGILIEQEYKTAYPSNTLLSCVVYLPTTQIAPAVIEMGELELLEIGAYPAPASAEDQGRAEAFAALVRKGRATAVVFEDIQVQRWKKLVLNCGWNPVCALSRSRDVAVLDACDEAEGYVRAVMMEVAAVARRVGYGSFDEGMVEEVLGRAKARMGTRGIEPSMLADVRGGRSMEVEAILGGVVRMGKELGVEVTRLEGLYVLCRALDQRIQEDHA